MKLKPFLSRRAFTLAEIMVTVIILAGLATMALPQLTKFVDNSKSDEGKNILRVLMGAQLDYNRQHGEYASNVANLSVTVPSPKYFGNPDLNFNRPAIIEKNGKYVLYINVDGRISCDPMPASSKVCSNLGLPSNVVNDWVPSAGDSCPGRWPGGGTVAVMSCQHPAVQSGCCTEGDSFDEVTSACVVTATCPGGGGCFLAGTMITMADGTEKNIEFMKEGDMVLSYDEASKQMKPGMVEKILHHPNEDLYFVINGHMKVTPIHPLLSQGVWKEAGTLKVGDTLTDVNGKDVPIVTMERVEKEVDIYNFEVKDYHTYVAEGMIVHNKIDVVGSGDVGDCIGPMCCMDGDCI